MANRSPERERLKVEDVQPTRSRHLRTAADRLVTVLQSLDLDAETRLAEEVAEAMRATDRARELEAERPETGSDVGSATGAFVFRSSRQEGERSRDR